jgi:Abnormal spindle-like microcephaly-assoc'd, ASPM-SPD-2-Hydin
MRYAFIKAFTHPFRFILPGLMLMSGMLAVLLPQTFTHPSAGNIASAHAVSLNAIQTENSNPGTPGWNDFSAVLNDTTLSGYGSKISVNHGDSIDFYVTTTSSSVSIDIYRTGYYGGVGARKLASLGSFPGVQQPIPTPDPKTGIISCNWTKTTTLNIPSNWVTGVYLAKLTDSKGDSSFIFFVVRNDGGHEAIDFQTSVTTYEAYNTWGGTSLYNNNTNGKIYPYPHATKVSFDRPFNPGDSNGAGHYLFYEYKFVYWAESQGFDLTYTTDVDTDTNVNPLTNHKAFLSVGHDEYWSKGMRDNVQNAINAGVNAAFFSANSVYWQIRFEPNAAGVPNRVEVGYKDFAEQTDPPGPDPQWNVNNALVTTTWRDPVVNKPENGLMGVMYEEQVNQSYPFVVKNASNWVYTGTGFVDGSSVAGIVGYEYDKVWNNGATPSGLTILGNSPVVGNEGVGNSVSNATIYKAASGAWVFAAGTIQWSWGLANIQSNTYANAGIQQMTANILNAFTTGFIPSVNVSPTSLTFGNQAPGTTSAAQAVKLTNNGLSALSISNIALTGTNAGDFAQTNNCPNSLAASSSCTINVTFTPATNGSRTASVTITDSASDSPQSIALTGTGYTNAPAATLSPASVSFGNQNSGASSPAQTVKLTNSGTLPLSISSIAFSGPNASDFAQTNTCPSGSNTLAANASCTINVTFSPTATGSRSASLTLTDNAADSPQSVALTGTGVTGGSNVYFSDGFETGDLSKWTLSNSDSTGQISVQSSVVNSGKDAVSLTNASGQYAYINTALSSPQTQTYTRFYFRLSSNANGTMLAIARNANNGNIWEIDYNSNRHGLDIYFWNGANTLYSLASAQNVINANTWYYVEVQDNEITSGQAQVWLNGTSIGTVNNDLSTANPYARLMLFDSAAGSVYFDDVKVANAYIGALAPSPAVKLNPGSLTFSNQEVGTSSAAQTITLTNTGAASLTISNIAISGTNAADFAQTNNCPSSLAANASCTINVTFSPTSTGSRTANLKLTDNADDSPQSIALSGTGYTNAPAVSLNPTTVNFGNQNSGASSPAQTVKLTNSGTLPLSISSIAFTGANASDFAQTNNCPSGSNTLAANASCTINVTFSPTATGSRTANLTLTDNAANSPQIVTLNGKGITAGVYFSDGFESGDFSAWSQAPGGNGQASVQTSVVHGGNDAAAFTNTSGQYAMVSTGLNGGGQSLTYTRFYFNLPSLTSTSLIAAAQDSNGKNVWIIYYDAGRHGLDIYFWNGAGKRYDLYSNTNVISANTWYSVEVEDNETSSGHGEVWLNGTSIAAFDGDLSTSTPYATFVLFYEGVGTIYFDDVAVKNSF